MGLALRLPLPARRPGRTPAGVDQPEWPTSPDSWSSNATPRRRPRPAACWPKGSTSSTPGPWPGRWSCSASSTFAGVYVDTAQLSAVRWAGVLIQADEILDAIADGVAVVDPDLRIIWSNPEFAALAEPAVELIGAPFYRALGSPEVIGPSPARSSRPWRPGPGSTALRIGANRYLRVTATPVFDGRGGRPT